MKTTFSLNPLRENKPQLGPRCRRQTGRRDFPLAPLNVPQHNGRGRVFFKKSLWSIAARVHRSSIQITSVTSFGKRVPADGSATAYWAAPSLREVDARSHGKATPAPPFGERHYPSDPASLKKRQAPVARLPASFRVSDRIAAVVRGDVADGPPSRRLRALDPS
jgi:hypothetical protein